MSVTDEIAAERKRQVEVEGWSAHHDDKHSQGEMALAAAWYAMNSVHYPWSDSIPVDDPRHEANGLFSNEIRASHWPWDMKWWKPKDQRRDLIRAAALIVAEIERIDRETSKQ